MALPTYAFDRVAYDYERMSPAGQAPAVGGVRPPVHPLLEAEVRSPRLPQTIVQAHVGATTPACIADHRIYGHVIFPLSGYVEMVLAAMRAENGAQAVELRDVSIEAPLVFEGDDQRLLQLVLERENQGQRAFEILSAPAASSPRRSDPWVRHMTGTVSLASDVATAIDVNALRAEFPEAGNVESFYAELASAGVEYGPSFRTLAELRRGPSGTLGLIRAPQEPGNPFVVHPGMLDAAFQVFGDALSRQERQDEVSLPIGFSRLRISSRPVPAETWSHAVVNAASDAAKQVRTGDISWIGSDGQAVLEIERFAIKRAPLASLLGARRPADDNIYRVEWLKDDAAAASSQVVSRGGWIIFADERGVAERLAPQLAPAPVILIRRGAAFEHTSESEIVTPAGDTDLRRAFTAARAAMDGCRGIVHAWSIDSPGPSSDAASLLTFQEACCGSLMTLARLADNGATVPSLVVVTAGAHAIAEGDDADPGQAPAWAMAGTWANELARPCLRIDVDAAIETVDLETLAREVDGTGRKTRSRCGVLPDTCAVSCGLAIAAPRTRNGLREPVPTGSSDPRAAASIRSPSSHSSGRRRVPTKSRLRYAPAV